MEKTVLKLLFTATLLATVIGFSACSEDDDPTGPGGESAATGQEIFRHDTFGDEQYWTDILQMNSVIQNAVDPATALSVGLKVDSDVLPDGLLATADLTDPATTVALIGLDAVVGLKGKVDANGNLLSVGVTCALCHSTVDDFVAPGIGRRIDGPPNRDLNPGVILSLSPALQDPDTQAVLTSWGAGFFDPRWNQDGINKPVIIPPIYGLQDVALETYTGDGPVSYWNAYIGVTQMGGQGSFSDPRIGLDIVATPDLITPKLDRLLEYQLSLATPTRDASGDDVAAVARGRTVFEGAADCSRCHSGIQFTDAGTRLHDAASIGMDPVTAERSATGQYRTTPLRALAAHPPYFHDGSAETLDDVVRHYDDVFELGLDAGQIADLIAFLETI